MSDNNRIEEILGYWFGENDADTAENLRPSIWFQGGPAVDQEIRDRFYPLIGRAGLGELESWKKTPRGRIAWILLLDQFTRNVYRGNPRTYAYDILALQAAREAIAWGQHREMPLMHRTFLYLPLEHAEELQAQDECVALYEELAEEAKGTPVEESVKSMLDYAHRHAVVIRRFGRYPHRNELLARRSTLDELDFLASPAAPF